MHLPKTDGWQSTDCATSRDELPPKTQTSPIMLLKVTEWWLVTVRLKVPFLKEIAGHDLNEHELIIEGLGCKRSTDG